MSEWEGSPRVLSEEAPSEGNQEPAREGDALGSDHAHLQARDSRTCREELLRGWVVNRGHLAVSLKQRW